jgi:hypothetical protein
VICELLFVMDYFFQFVDLEEMLSLVYDYTNFFEIEVVRF